jgi:hypothetical protein
LIGIDEAFQEKEECSFLKKRTKKLLSWRPHHDPTRQQPTYLNGQKFFGSFFQKRTLLPYLPIGTHPRPSLCSISSAASGPSLPAA